MVGVVRTGVLTLLTGPKAHDEALATLRRWAQDTDRSHIWTTLGHHTLLAHLAADHGLTEFTDLLLAHLDPYRDRIAVIGQVGMAGPVALATARLHALRGDAERARADLATARAIAERTDGVPALLRCRLLDCELAGPSAQRSADAAALASEAAHVGMAAVAAAATRLT